MLTLKDLERKILPNNGVAIWRIYERKGKNNFYEDSDLEKLHSFSGIHKEQQSLKELKESLKLKQLNMLHWQPRTKCVSTLISWELHLRMN
jgi:hypothetical protein